MRQTRKYHLMIHYQSSDLIHNLFKSVISIVYFFQVSHFGAYLKWAYLSNTLSPHNLLQWYPYSNLTILYGKSSI